MTVTAKDMRLIATKLRTCLGTLHSDAAHARVAAAQCVVAVGSALAESNPLFDWQRFAEAAIPDGWNVSESYRKTPSEIIRQIRAAEQLLEELRAELEEAYK